MLGGESIRAVPPLILRSVEHPSRSGRFAIVLSIIAIVISVYSAEQARRAAVANERLAMIAEEQTRPRLTFTNPRALLSPSEFEVTATIKNLGNAPASIQDVRIETIENDPRGTYVIRDAVGAILYPGDTRVVSLTRPRVIKRGTWPETDYGMLKPETFGFTVAYRFLGKAALEFEEAIQFGHLQWTSARLLTGRR